MTRSLRLYVKARSAVHRAEIPRWTRRRQTIGASVGALGLALAASLAPQPAPTAAEELAAYVDAHAQTFEVPALVDSTAVARDTYSATPGIATLAAGGTNHDWAKLVLLFAKLPMTESNVTVFTRWMRQENGTNDWWNRNNPLNNGWGSGGGSGLGSYDSLVIAAENAAEALRSHSGYAGIVAAFAASAPTAEIEQAIWASPWASGHYANGGHWSYVPVPVVVSPSGTW
jgi:hypothetical protein